MGSSWELRGTYMTNNVNYKDYSNRTTFDGSIPNDDEMIVPVVLTKELKQLIDLKGYKNYCRNHHLCPIPS